MKRSKLFIMALATPMLLLGTLTSCGVKKTGHTKFVESKPTSGLDFLYEVTYHDYSWDDVANWMNSDTPNNDAGGFGCSSIHIGDYYGRSFDFCITDMCEFLVRTEHENDHFASIGVAIADCMVNKEKVEKINNGTGGEKEKLNEKLIPFTMVDGINEYGVVCNTNVVPAKDLPAHEGEEKYHTHGTNPGKTDLFYQFMPRYILDNATSAKHAVRLLQNLNLTAINSKGKVRDYLGISNMGYELHCMIADKNETYIIELFNDKMAVIPGHIMTNYYLTEQTPSGAGWERYQSLYYRKKDSHDESETPVDVKSVEDMQKLIQYVQYSPCYNPEWKADALCPMWPTEFSGCDIIKETGEIGKLTFDTAEEYCRANWTEGANIKTQLSSVYDEIQTKLTDPSKRTSELGGAVPWISTHVDVYDMKNKTLYLDTQEKMDSTNAESYYWHKFEL